MKLQVVFLGDGFGLEEGAHGIPSLGICTVPTLWAGMSGHLCFRYLTLGSVSSFTKAVDNRLAAVSLGAGAADVSPCNAEADDVGPGSVAEVVSLVAEL